MLKFLFFRVVLALGCCLCAVPLPLGAQTAGTPFFDPVEFAQKVAAQEKKLLDDGKLHTLGSLLGALKAQPGKEVFTLPAPSNISLDPAGVHDRLLTSTLVVGLYYHCKDCHQMHFSTGGGFVVAPGGVVTTCAHIMTLDPRRMLQAFSVAIDARGEVHPIDRIIAFDEVADTVLVQVQGFDAPPLPLRADPRVGEPVYCLSHPNENPFIFTTGLVSRADGRRAGGRVLRSLAVSSEYSPGSSGCPIADASGNVLAQARQIFPQLMEIDAEKSAANRHEGTASATVYNLRSATSAVEIARLADPATRPAYTAQPPVAADDAASSTPTPMPAAAAASPAPAASAGSAPSPAGGRDVFDVHCRYELFTAPASIGLEGVTSFEKLREKIDGSEGKVSVWDRGTPPESTRTNDTPVGFTGVTGYAQMPGTDGPLTHDNALTRGVDFRFTFQDRKDSEVGLLVKVNDNRETPTAADNAFEVKARVAKGAFTLVKLGPPQKDTQAWLALQVEDFETGTVPPVQVEGGLSGDKKVDFKFTAADGQEVDTTRWRGKVILVDFWATWCGPCVEALPQIQALYDRFHKDGLEVLGINLDERRSAMDPFLKKHPHPWPQSVSAPVGRNPLADRFNTEGIPYFLLIGKTGTAEVIEARNPGTADLIATRLKQ